MLESVYQRCMLIELENHGLKIQAEVPVPIFFHGQNIHDEGFRIDLLIEDKIVVELKSKETGNDIETFEFCEYQNYGFNNFSRLQVQHRWF